MRSYGSRYPDGSITATFVQVPLWFFEGRTGALRFLRSQGALAGEEMLDGEWLVTVGDGIGIAAAVLAMSKTLSRNDWLLFLRALRTTGPYTLLRMQRMAARLGLG